MCFLEELTYGYHQILDSPFFIKDSWHVLLGQNFRLIILIRISLNNHFLIMQFLVSKLPSMLFITLLMWSSKTKDFFLLRKCWESSDCSACRNKGSGGISSMLINNWGECEKKIKTLFFPFYSQWMSITWDAARSFWTTGNTCLLSGWLSRLPAGPVSICWEELMQEQISW